MSGAGRAGVRGAGEKAREASAAGERILELGCGPGVVLALPGSFDAAFAVNVNLFWTGPADLELAVLARVLRPGGRLHLLYDSPGGSASDGRSEKTATVSAAVTAAGFAQVATASLDGAVAVSAVNAR